ncbi:MAG: 16S rRNA (cytosine(1402)-N(4))-methyltransferase RsmH [Deltaproteobacteria bacterium]|nr:16S rRNA (cytosine(1402)-N(4))-methyltransferase RsmH [Deltaproteobacteria bacterium]
MDTPHQPVLVEEVIQGLAPRPGGLYVDATLGAGGHAAAILEKLGGEGKLIGVDCDEEILSIARRRLESYEGQVQFVLGHYEDLPEILSGLGAGPGAVDGLLIDLGVSSLQLDRPERGFSFLREGALDMRMDLSQHETAAQLVSRLPERELVKIFRDWGEEPQAVRIARAIAETRRRRPLRTTRDLASLIEDLFPGGRRMRIHPATRVFQALRIAVNHELERLKSFLSFFPDLLRPGGRGVFLAYHSLEDRLVKRSLRQFQREGKVKILTRKPIRPVERELATNPRSRSARLRYCERCR